LRAALERDDPTFVARGSAMMPLRPCRAVPMKELIFVLRSGLEGGAEKDLPSDPKPWYLEEAEAGGGYPPVVCCCCCCCCC